MTLRFRPAHIRVINRRLSSPLPPALLSKEEKAALSLTGKCGPEKTINE
jgi:hypothetical protein